MSTCGLESCGPQQPESTFPCRQKTRSPDETLYRVHVGRDIDNDGRVRAFVAEYERVAVGDEDCYVIPGGYYLARGPFDKPEWFACKREAQVEAANRVKQLGMRLMLQAEILLDEIMPARPDHD